MRIALNLASRRGALMPLSSASHRPLISNREPSSLDAPPFTFSPARVSHRARIVALQGAVVGVLLVVIYLTILRPNDDNSVSGVNTPGGAPSIAATAPQRPHHHKPAHHHHARHQPPRRHASAPAAGPARRQRRSPGRGRSRAGPGRRQRADLPPARLPRTGDEPGPGHPRRTTSTPTRWRASGRPCTEPAGAPHAGERRLRAGPQLSSGRPDPGYIPERVDRVPGSARAG